MSHKDGIDANGMAIRRLCTDIRILSGGDVEQGGLRQVYLYRPLLRFIAYRRFM